MTAGPDRAGEARPYGRRAFLALVAGGISSLFWAAPAWRAVTSALEPVLPAGLAPSRGWRIFSVATPMPEFDPATWRLTVDGLVERPLSLSYEELLSLPRSDQISDFHCVTGWSVEDVHWAGVRFGDLLAEARPLPAAGALAFRSAERPYFDSLTLEQALLEDVLLAYELDGEPLTRPHGAPARVVMPRMYGYKSVKWVERIEVVERPVGGFWEARGWEWDAWIDGAEPLDA